MQILVYVGGVMVLFLFVIMLVNVGAEERGAEMIFNSETGRDQFDRSACLRTSLRSTSVTGSSAPATDDAEAPLNNEPLNERMRAATGSSQDHKRHRASRQQSLSLRVSAV